MENNNRQGCRLKELIDWIDTFGFAKDHETTKQIIRFKVKQLLESSPIEPCATSSESYWEQPLGFEISVIENMAAQKGQAIMMLHPDDYKTYSEQLKQKP